MNAAVPPAAIKSHLNNYWPQHRKEFFTWELGPIKQALPRFLVCRIAPNAIAEPWVYVTVGASAIELSEPCSYSIEFLLLAPDDNARHIETLAIVAYYHATGAKKLDCGQIVNMGRPWLGHSECDHLLVSLPYPFGEDLEWCRNPTQRDIRILWLLPITTSEATYSAVYGVEALERRFDQRAIDAVDPTRASVV